MFVLRWIANSSHSSNHAQSMSRRAETQILCNRRSPGSLSRLTSASNALCPGCGRRCDRARQGPASSPAPAYIGAQRGGFPSALPARRRPEGFCVPTPRSGRTEERPRLSIAASHSIEGRSTLAGSRLLRAGAPSFGRPGRVPASSGQMRPGIRFLKCLPPKGKRPT